MFLCSYVLMFSWLLIPRLAEHEFGHASLCGRIALAHDGYKLVALEEVLVLGLEVLEQVPVVE